MTQAGSWAEVYRRLGYVIGSEPSAREWVAQALEQQWGVADPSGLGRQARALALQRLSGVVLALEDEPGDLGFYTGVRGLVARTFARYFRGIVLEGPPWRMSPYEDLPTRAEWLASADF